jgi:hypothetical protein
VIGVGSRVEVWQLTAWKVYIAESEEEFAALDDPRRPRVAQALPSIPWLRAANDSRSKQRSEF